MPLRADLIPRSRVASTQWRGEPGTSWRPSGRSRRHQAACGLYAAAKDRALLVSRNFWGHYRAGDVPATGPLVVGGIDTIDITAASTDVFALNHSDYAQNNDLLTDIGKLITTERRPPDGASTNSSP